MQDRLISGSEKPEDHFDRAIRPTSLDDYIGQPVVREQMEIFIGAARGREELLDHTFDLGPPGLGKTTLRQYYCPRNGWRSQVGLLARVLERAGDLAAMLTNLEEAMCSFIDEIHRLSPVIEESCIRRWKIISSIS